MDTLYIDCRMGATAVKIFGALIDVMENPNLFVYNFNKICMDGISIQRQDDALNGVTGSQIDFIRRASDELDPYADELDDEEESSIRRHNRRSRGLDDVIDIIDAMDIKNSVADRAIRIYENIVNAYAKANNKASENVKLRRTGSKDVIAAVVGICFALDELKPERVIASTVAVGNGYTRTPRGKMPIPTPEIQLLLEGKPYTAGTENGKLCDLCGAAIIAEIADEFGNLPEMSLSRLGAGFGRRTFKNGINCVRAYLGKALFTTADEAYINLSAEIYDIDKTALKELGNELENIGIMSATVSETESLNGIGGYMLNVIVSSENADAVATYILENTDTKHVIRKLVNAYSR